MMATAGKKPGTISLPDIHQARVIEMRRGTKSAILLPSSSTPIYPCDSTTVSLPPSSSTSNASSQQELDDKEVTQITQSQGPLRFPEMDTATKLPMIAFSNDKTHPPSSQQDDTSWHLPAIVERGKMSDMPGRHQCQGIRNQALTGAAENRNSQSKEEGSQT